jgi:hypothetical protein
VKDELERIWKEAVVASRGIVLGTYMQWLRKTTKYLSQENRDFNRGSPEWDVIIIIIIAIYLTPFCTLFINVLLFLTSYSC